jgi:hypothetical protein
MSESTAVVRSHADEPLTIARQPEADFAALMNLAKALVPTGFLPDHIKTAGQAVAIILTGREMGVGPMQSLRSIVMVKGKPTVSADLQLAVFKRNGGKATFLHLDDQRAVLELTHPNGDRHTETFTMADARAAGLTNETYRKWPKAMLRSRAITAGLKSVGFEPCAGAYDPEELAPVMDDGRNGSPPKAEGPTETPAPTIAADTQPLRNCTLRKRGRFFVVEGDNIQDHNDLLASLGWKWDPKKKFYWHPEEGADEAADTVGLLIPPPETLADFPKALEPTEGEKELDSLLDGAK